MGCQNDEGILGQEDHGGRACGSNACSASSLEFLQDRGRERTCARMVAVATSQRATGDCQRIEGSADRMANRDASLQATRRGSL